MGLIPMDEDRDGRPVTVLEDIIAALKDNAKSCGDCGEGEYRGAMSALNIVEALLGRDLTKDM
jgi:hypothetical protein